MKIEVTEDEIVCPECGTKPGKICRWHEGNHVSRMHAAYSVSRALSAVADANPILKPTVIKAALATQKDWLELPDQDTRSSFHRRRREAIAKAG